MTTKKAETDQVLQTFLDKYFGTGLKTTPSDTPKKASEVKNVVLDDALSKMLAPPNYTPSKSSFDDFADLVLTHEGGYTVDQGGPTMRGVTWRDNSDLLTQMGYSQNTLKNLTKDDAKKIYKTRYFDQPGLNKLPGDLQYYAFDYSVNSGPTQAIKSLQKVVGAKVDGKIGESTLKKINEFTQKYGARNLKEAYVKERKMFLQDLVKKNPEKHGQSLKGWMNRIASLNKSIVNEA